MYCILVAGVPASGKTTYAKYIGKELGIPVISKDEIKEILFDDIGFDSREEKMALGVASMNTMYYFARKCMQGGQPFILENNFEYVSIEGLRRLLDGSDYRVLTIRIQGDLHTIYHRFLDRDKSPDRHPGHIVNTRYPLQSKEDKTAVPPAFDVFQNSVQERGMVQFSFGEKCIEIDTSRFDERDRKACIQKVREWIENN